MDIKKRSVNSNFSYIKCFIYTYTGFVIRYFDMYPILKKYLDLLMMINIFRLRGEWLTGVALSFALDFKLNLSS